VRDIDELRQRLLHVWRSLEQSLIDDAVDQWPTRLRVCAYMADILNISCDCQFVFFLYLMNFTFHTMTDAVDNILF